MDKEKIDELFYKLEKNRLEKNCDDLLRHKIKVLKLEDKIVNAFEKKLTNIVYVENSIYDEKVVSEACNNDYCFLEDVVSDNDLIVVRPNSKQKLFCFLYKNKPLIMFVSLILAVLLFFASIVCNSAISFICFLVDIVSVTFFGIAYDVNYFIEKLEEC